MERGVIPILGARNALQLRDLLTATQFTLDADATAALDAAGQIDLGYPRSLLEGPMGPRMLHGDRAGEIVGR
jgi:diketogulonate reductase-like aldo/keto reductase